MNKDGYCIMVDVSGSTGGSDNYWSTVGNVLSLYSDRITEYYEWDDQIRMITKKDLENLIAKKTGKNGTYPLVCAQKIIQENYKNLILITDGQVGDVQQCD